MTELDVLQEVVNVLEQHKISYWLGRGRFRHFKVAGDFGNKGDIDIHVFHEQQAALEQAEPHFIERGYRITARKHHKLSLSRPIPGKYDVAVEFVFLFADNTSSDEIRYHETLEPLRKRFLCPVEVFGSDHLDIRGVTVRVPADEYLPCVFGPRWREDRKGTGGVEV